MKIIVEIKRNPGEDGMCETFNIYLKEDDILSLAEKVAETSGVITRKEIFDSEILYIKP